MLESHRQRWLFCFARFRTRRSTRPVYRRPIGGILKLVFAFLLLTVTANAQTRLPPRRLCEAQCVTILAGPAVKKQIEKIPHRYFSDTILLEEFGKVSGRSLESMRMACLQKQSDNGFDPPDGAFVRRQILEAYEFDKVGDQKIVTRLQEKFSCSAKLLN